MQSYEGSPQDEGYSEDPLTVANSGSLPSWVQNMTAPERLEYVMAIISHLPTSQVAEIVARVRPRLYINFFKHLPQEICLKVLGFLDPNSLINTARASREWMGLALDRKLWQHLYMLEGFKVIQSEVEQFETSLNANLSGVDRPGPGGRKGDGHASKKRATPQRVLPGLQNDEDSEMFDVDAVSGQQTSIFGGAMTKEPLSTHQDAGVQMHSPSSPRIAQFESILVDDLPSKQINHALPESTSAPIASASSLVVVDQSDNRKRLNWQYLYSQRRRLEANWEAEKYTNFQLPHPDFPEEAHEECIYTIQHSGRYLVSGSRDRTLRIWNLDTRRLVRPPLCNHQGSVLCLQFDADPEEDIIVSGSSDATIVIWKFSTGGIVQRLRKAHRESVLNVRFDKRVLVTCSKDKTIKVFNRRPLNAGDPGYPVFQGVHPVPTYLDNYGFNPSPTAGLPIKPAFSMIGCLEGHGAAVNAVQIWGDEVVSASGDRTVKIWNWTDGTCIRTLLGHQKGIACVQYDGRRIVSGSSDNEVKVFDSKSGLEVASLRAHSNLVRTVQAGFGDSPYSVEEDRDAAKAIDNEYFRAVDSGEVSRAALLQRGRLKNAGSKRPTDITAYGAKVPPGGGGGKFGRIVSGSYDETIIIWRRDKEGVWKAQHTLRQEQAALVASRPTVPAVPENTSETDSTVVQPSQSPVPPATIPQPVADAPSLPFAPGSDQYYHHLISITVPQGRVALRRILQQHPRMLDYEQLHIAIAALNESPEQIDRMRLIVENALIARQHGQNSAASQAGPSSAQAGPASTQADSSSTQAVPSSSQSSQSFQSQAVAVASTSQGASIGHAINALAQQWQPSRPPTPAGIPTSSSTVLPTPHATPVPAPHQHHAHHLPANMARVFKLQFDARRIICCSQTSTIVGWDFANGDEQIIEASRFFAPIE
ncbi:uncharacterized protein L3040_008042 [Drepanopeziza brunnea f. sp. 'multigermtubi']|uniref:WD domain-containing protein n=1 Tax=Marssonina brunnea f. sp. multigermtubi (strain MB_m1) TaxID=1072389 RepID=K1XY88_MARBU|nr:WD domain-containing protein [Drepanopeziza brunnea f. sp. 'multigermtubi' MB_m1]EKD17774.1 WD domain-containing protein [Drepanopeziza brunnea f. sp. 'multigermtubi' MB_m1]KAJ5035576.1 hypothetical protein L3040_008042 [Drepanopeziza brunnea f. sp. 'multigermtubi']